MPNRNSDDEPLQGEEAIIALLAPLTGGHPGAFALRDDCAVLTPEPDTELVLKTDPVVEGIHFLPADTPQDIAWKALAVNVSDLAAKAAAPVGYLMALSFPVPPTRGWMSAFAEGLQEAQTEFGCRLLGGDTDRRPGAITISITAIGSVPRGGMVRRGSARVGDVLFVSGTLGDAWLGLRLIQHPGSRELSDADAAFLHRRYRRPQPRLALAGALRQYASAAMDISDGLVKDLERMLRASGKAGVLDLSATPLSGPAQRVAKGAPEVLMELATAGDDYEVLAAVPAANATAFAGAAAEAGIPVTQVGTVNSGPPKLTVRAADGSALVLPERRGWDHF